MGLLKREIGASRGEYICEAGGLRFMDITEVVREEAARLREGVLFVNGATPKTLQEANRGVEHDLADMLGQWPAELKRYRGEVIIPIAGGAPQLGTYQSLITFGEANVNFSMASGAYVTGIQLDTSPSATAPKKDTPFESRVDITQKVRETVNATAKSSGIKFGIAYVTTLHTTCSVIARATELGTVTGILEQLAPTGRGYHHNKAHQIYTPQELPNGQAHLKASLLGQSTALPIEDGQLNTGKRIILADFDARAVRNVCITLQELKPNPMRYANRVVK